MFRGIVRQGPSDRPSRCSFWSPPSRSPVDGIPHYTSLLSATGRMPSHYHLPGRRSFHFVSHDALQMSVRNLACVRSLTSIHGVCQVKTGDLKIIDVVLTAMQEVSRREAVATVSIGPS